MTWYSRPPISAAIATMMIPLPDDVGILAGAPSQP